MAWSTQNSFTGGEISRRMWGRVDLAQYRNSVAELKNFMLHPHGGITRRSGTRHVTSAKSDSTTCRLIPFVFSASQSYCLEVGDESIRIIKNGEQVEHTLSTVSAWLTATSYVVGNYVKESSVIYRCIVAHTSGTFATDLAADKWLAQSIVEVTTPWDVTELDELQHVQSADVMWFVHPSYAPRKLSRLSDTSWALTTETWREEPYGLVNTTTTTMLPSGASGSINITASSTTGVNGGKGFLTTDVGRKIRIFNATTAKWSYATITGRTSATVVTADVGADAISVMRVGTELKWKLGIWGATTGYPAAVGFHEGRLFYGGGNPGLQRIDGTQTDTFDSFQVNSPADSVDAVSFQLLSNDGDIIRWIMPSKWLAIGTSGGEWIVSGSSSDSAITPTSIRARRHTTHGSSIHQPIHVGNVVLFKTRTNKELREFAYTFDNDSYKAPDLFLLAEHLTRTNTIGDLGYQKEPDGVVWCVRDDGTLLGLTYQREQQVVGWHRHELSGVVESLAVVPEVGRDVVYLLVRRTINGSTVRHIEYIESEFAGDDIADAFYVDAGVTYDSTPTTTIIGLDHLEGETVRVLADGMVVAPKVVSGGAITLPYAASKVHVGLPIKARMKTLPLEAAAGDGQTIGRTKLISRVAVKFVDTYGGKIGPNDSELDEIIFNENQTFGEAPAPFSGEKAVNVSSGHRTECHVIIEADNNLPMTVIVLNTEFDASSR